MPSLCVVDRSDELLTTVVEESLFVLDLELSSVGVGVGVAAVDVCLIRVALPVL